MISNSFALLSPGASPNITVRNKQLASPGVDIAKSEAPQTMCGQMVSSHLAASLLPLVLSQKKFVAEKMPRSTDLK